MKKLLSLALVAWLLPAALYAQEFKTKFASSQNRKVVLDMHGADQVTVEGYDGDELLITGSGYREMPVPAGAMNLRPIYAGGGGDNTRLGLNVTATGDNTLRITCPRGADGRYTVRVPRRTDVAFAQNSWNSEDLTLRNLAGRVEVSLKSGDLRLLNMSGPVVANTISGDIRVQFNGVPDQPCALSTVSGDVDVSLPAPAKVTLSMRSVSGEIYTDFDLSLGNGDMKHVGGQTVEGRANGGGTSFSLKTVSGDIFVRKGK